MIIIKLHFYGGDDAGFIARDKIFGRHHAYIPLQSVSPFTLILLHAGIHKGNMLMCHLRV